MAGFSFTAKVDKVLKGLSDDVKLKVVKAYENASNEIADKLGTAYENGGYSAFDKYRKNYYGKKADRTKHHYNYWTVRNRVTSQGIGMEIRNRIPYASVLYKEPFYSSKHTGEMYWTADKKHVTYKKPTGKKVQPMRAYRDDQITKKRYMRIQTDIKRILKKEVVKVIPSAKASTTYKG